MASNFRIQIVDCNGELVTSWLPGSTVELEFIDTLTTAIIAKGVGVLTTEAKVRTRIHEALREYLLGLKSAVRPPQ